MLLISFEGTGWFRLKKLKRANPCITMQWAFLGLLHQIQFLKNLRRGSYKLLKKHFYSIHLQKYYKTLMPFYDCSLKCLRQWDKRTWKSSCPPSQWLCTDCLQGNGQAEEMTGCTSFSLKAVPIPVSSLSLEHGFSSLPTFFSSPN